MLLAIGRPQVFLGLQQPGNEHHLVRAYADDWGWFQVNGANAGAAGKYVWCEPPVRESWDSP
ncbi:hypothetical protein AB0D57_09080 [Streptomyces sp. NPDC048275]|uniref:hypothetical protein n=1 Tax=Streptomyces sp. NPDC048275 TaxID=3155629 RepID=UPI0033F4171B